MRIREFTRSSRVGLAVVLGAGMLAAGVASADSGPYVGVGVGFGFDNFDAVGSVDPAYGVDAWAGYRLFSLLAVEGQLEYLNGFKGTGFGSANLITMTGNAKVYPLGFLPVVDPFVFAGVGFEWIDEADATDFAARFGAGLDLVLTDSFALNGSFSYVLPTGDLDGADYWSLVFGLQF